MRPSLVIEAAGVGYAFASFGQLAVNVFRGQPGAEAAAVNAKIIDRMNATHPGGIAILSVYEPGFAAPDAGSRKLIGDALKRSKLLASAHVVEGDGLKSMAIRVGVSAFGLLAPHPSRAMDRAEAAADWIAPLAFGTEAGAAEVADAIRTVRSKIVGSKGV